MSVVYVLVWHEIARLYVQSHLLVCVPEWHSVGSKAVDLLNREYGVVHRIVHDVSGHAHPVYDICRHAETVVQLSESGKEDLLDNLKVTEVSAWEIVHDECHLLWQCLYLVAFGAYKLEDIGVLLMWHNGRACRTLLGELHKLEVL